MSEFKKKTFEADEEPRFAIIKPRWRIAWDCKDTEKGTGVGKD